MGLLNDPSPTPPPTQLLERTFMLAAWPQSAAYRPAAEQGLVSL